MYCSACGSAVSPNLVYCNRCGAKVGGSDTSSSEWSPDSIAWAMVALFIFGMGVIVGLIAVMKNVFSFNPGFMIALTTLSFLLLLTVEAIFGWLLIGARKAARQDFQPEQLREQTTRELNEDRTPALPEPGTSVTDHTTRAFEPIYNKRK